MTRVGDSIRHPDHPADLPPPFSAGHWRPAHPARDANLTGTFGLGLPPRAAQREGLDFFSPFLFFFCAVLAVTGEIFAFWCLPLASRQLTDSI